MEVIQRLPASTLLNPSSFQDVKEGDKHEKHLTLGVTHSVCGVLSGKEIGGSSVIKYRMHIDVNDKSLCPHLNVTEKVTPLAYQNSDEFKALVNSVRPKTGYDLSAFTGIYFDLRAVAYACCVVVAMGAADIQVNLSTSKVAKVKSIGNVWHNPNAGEVLIAPTLIKTDSEWSTLACILGMSGGRFMTYMSDTIPPDGRQLAGPALASFGLRLFGTILSSADAMGVAAHHELAFFRGLSSKLVLHAHSDEGGWIRTAMKMADYPPPQGLLIPLGATGGDIPLVESIALGDTLRWAVAYLLRGAGIMSAINSGSGKVAIICETDETGRPGGVKGLLGIYTHLSKWRDAVTQISGYMPEVIGDTASLRTYFQQNAVDRHLNGPFVSPYFWVEPTGIVDIDGSLPQPAGYKGKRVLPLFPGLKAVYKHEHYQELGSCVVRDSALLLHFKERHPRMSGSSYLLNPLYNPKNGVSCFIPVTDARLGVHYNGAMFCDPEAQSMGGQRWITPHNPIANPMEGLCLTDCLYRFVHPGTRNMPNYNDLMNANVESVVGPFYVTSPEGYADKRTHTDVPPLLRMFLRTLVEEPQLTAVDNSMNFIGLIPVVATMGPVPPPLPYLDSSLVPGDSRTTVMALPDAESGMGLRSVEPVDVSTSESALSTYAGLLEVKVKSGEVDPPIKHDVKVGTVGDDNSGLRPKLPKEQSAAKNGSD
jgi:hypothetical protein